MTKVIEPAVAEAITTETESASATSTTNKKRTRRVSKTRSEAKVSNTQGSGTQGSGALAPADIVKNKTLLGGYAYQIIRQQSKQISKLRSQVLADTDIENLHQMRISTRRLRSALMLFSDVVEIGKPEKQADNNNEKLIKGLRKITQSLGSVRDLDVMKAWFEGTLEAHSKATSKATGKTTGKTTANDFSKKEKKEIKLLLKKFKKRRKKQFSKLEETLESGSYKKLIRQFKQWVKQPTFTPTAQAAADSSAAQKIIEPITTLLTHPGWQMATHQATSQGKTTITPLANITLPQLNDYLSEEGENLHELRKQIKRVRYQTEFFRGIYGITYAAQVREFRALQKILGQLQDQIVISQFLTEELGTDWAKKLPTIEADFQQSRLALWQQWQPYQRKYLKLNSLLAGEAA